MSEIDDLLESTKPLLTECDQRIIKYKLANYEVQLPEGQYNSQFEDARYSLEKAKLEYLQTQQYYNSKIQEFEARELEIKQKEQNLMKKKYEIQHFNQVKAQQQREQEQQSSKTQKKQDEQLQYLIDLVDEIAGAQALYAIIQQREQQYNIYSQTIIKIYNELTNNQLTMNSEDQFTNIKNLNTAQFYTQNVFQKLQSETDQAIILENELQKQFDQLQNETINHQLSNEKNKQKFDQQIYKVTKQIEIEKVEKESMETELFQLNLKLSQKTVELSEALTSISNLCNKVEFQVRQNHRVNKMSIQELLGEKNPKLEAAVDDYYQKCKGQLNRDECYKRILGEYVVTKLQDLMKLSLWIQDSEQLIELCKQEQENGKK